MKRLKYLPFLMIVIFILTTAISCNYNGKATITITNVGELIVHIRIQMGFDQAFTQLDPGQQEIYELEWPGHKDQQVTYIRYPKDDDTRQIVETLTIKDGDNLELEVEFYPES